MIKYSIQCSTHRARPLTLTYPIWRGDIRSRLGYGWAHVIYISQHIAYTYDNNVLFIQSSSSRASVCARKRLHTQRLTHTHTHTHTSYLDWCAHSPSHSWTLTDADLSKMLFPLCLGYRNVWRVSLTTEQNFAWPFIWYRSLCRKVLKILSAADGYT